MGVVVMRCPRTGREVPTGAVMEREAFQALKPVIQRMRCPACGSEHVWSRGTARWKADTPDSAAESRLGRPKDILDGLATADAAAEPREPGPEPAGSRRISALVTKLLGGEK